MTHFYVLLLALGIGVVAGLRSFDSARRRRLGRVSEWINLTGRWAAWVGMLITVIVFTVLARR